ncbi:hypothetical protein D3C85_467160 [compost metagenome]
MSVTKIIQKKNMRPGKRKYTTAKADSSEIAILPMEIDSAMIRLTYIMRPTGAPDEPPDEPPNSACM